MGEPTNTAVWPTVTRTVSLQPQHYGDLTFGITHIYTVLSLFSLCALLLTVFVLGVLLSSYVYLLYYVCIAVLTLDAGLLARSQYLEGPATSHLDTGFSWFPCVYK